MKGRENITQNVTTIIPEKEERTASFAKNHFTSKREREAYIIPINFRNFFDEWIKRGSSMKS